MDFEIGRKTLGWVQQHLGMGWYNPRKSRVVLWDEFGRTAGWTPRVLECCTNFWKKRRNFYKYRLRLCLCRGLLIDYIISLTCFLLLFQIRTRDRAECGMVSNFVDTLIFIIHKEKSLLERTSSIICSHQAKIFN